MKSLRMLALLLLVTLGLVAVAGCEQDGPAERAGENIDEGMEEMGDQAEDMADDTEDAMD